MKQPDYKNYQAKRAEREREKQELLPKPWWWLKQKDPVARFTLYIGLLTAGLILVGILQWCVIRGQLKEMHEGGADTRNLALAAKLDQRAWVGYAILTLETPKLGDVVHASVTYVNTGRTPAKDVAPFTRQRFVPSLISSEAELLKFSKDGGSPAPIIGVMYPSMPYPSVIDGQDRFSEADLKAIADWYTYLWGEVSYTDVFDEGHTMQFCAYRKGITGGFLQCPFHNDPGYKSIAKREKNPN